MKATINISLEQTIAAAIQDAIQAHITQLQDWPYVDQTIAAQRLGLSVSALLDKRNGHLEELDYSCQGKRYWFTKETLHEYVQRRSVRRRAGRIPNTLRILKAA